MKVIINPTREQKGCGTTACCTWQNPDVQSAIVQLFRIQRHERLTQIEIDSEGITARMEIVPHAK